ncbi:hypothetical protein BJV82DRAFT_612329 [Fennellomyces sp. T-0311]|nr:hypothetical protein BJV82DRAFT_612329 [Fennellomyces sp. T-0311]
MSWVPPSMRPPSWIMPELTAPTLPPYPSQSQQYYAPMIDVHIIYIHGFLGSANTFKNLPEEVARAFNNSSMYPKVRVNKRLYIYQTKGRYKDAPITFYSDLCDYIRNEMAGCRSPAIILAGHSMGGFVAADTIRHIDNKGHPLPNGAKIIGLLAYDTPFYSIDNGFVEAVLHSLTCRPWSASLQLMKNLSKQKSDRQKRIENATVDIFGMINGLLGRITRGFPIPILYGLLNATVTATFVLGILGFYAFKECKNAPRSFNNETYAEKVFEYMTFAYENFRSGDYQRARVRDLTENKNIVFQCIYNQFPATSWSYKNRPMRFIALPKEHHNDRRLFVPLMLPSDFFKSSPNRSCDGGSPEAIALAHKYMFEPADSETLFNLYDMSIRAVHRMIVNYHSAQYYKDNSLW